MEMWRCVALVLCITTAIEGQKRQIQCRAQPKLCPQQCIVTLGGCSYCVTSCSSILGVSVNGLNGGNALGSYNSGPSISGSSASFSGSFGNFLSPNSMNQYQSLTGGSLVGSGSSQLGGGSQSQGFNPANTGPHNPYFGNSGVYPAFNPANPGQLNGPAPSGLNTGSLTGSVNTGQLNGGLTQPGAGTGQLNGFQPGALAGPVGNQGTSKTTTQSTTLSTTSRSTCAPIYCPSIKYVTTVNGCPVCKVPPTTVMTNTTAKMTSSTPPINAATCAPLRCVAPCDKGIGIGKDGCPMCLCK